ncbi:MAG TPA: putative lipid II flippase FtsW [Candidatus Scatomorpha intestinavium]|uniref:Probable peptidoglycan glycosyltransferase FtsW n=1 Tax=Candidatus Scatomorpha intestinavium TaxID=2840922 RepID=A0A9D0ZFI7_9FIRM|nr:putative lipid II flippase FtsW [Candidatus Scatomorpha intestinavium]
MEYAGTRLARDEERAPARRAAFDAPFAALTLLLLTIGVVMVLSASYARAYFSASTGHNAAYYFIRQLGFAAAGTAAMFILSRFPMSFYARMSFPVLAASVVLLALVPVIGVSQGDAKRWIDLGFTTFQPSEIAKIAVILYFAALICRFRARMRTFRYGILPFAAVLLLIVGLLVLEPHFSAAIIIIAIGAVMLFLGGARLYWFIGGGALLLGALAVVMAFFPYASNRIASWLDPFSNTQGVGYQIIQSLYAIGSGGLFGLGLGHGRQKYLYLPEEHNDFIFAVVCEELGFVGAVAILLLFALLIIRGYYLAMHMRDRFSFLVTAGITTLLAIQVILNVAVVTNLAPCTGISLPFFSYGGTALMIQLGEMGIILSASREIPAKT